MARYEHVALVHASKQVVWQWWTDVEKWPKWDTDLIESALLGECAVGTQGRMKVADDALVSFAISEVIPEERFVIQIALFGATLSYTHAMVEEDGMLKITHGADITGIFSVIWRLMLKKKIVKTLTPALDTLAAQVTAETERLALVAAQTPPPSPDAENAEVTESAPAEKTTEAPVEAAAPSEEKKEEEKPTGGDPVENALRAQDIHTQIEMAAQAPVPAAVDQEPTATPGGQAASPSETQDSIEEEHTAMVPVSEVITKKETKRPKKDS
ncbi:MAG: hypothetical protein QG604_978 [Candidatus Dependentiae bacterium]|nr:hypothetical protein [Candidatus Dependentiae bacterium]